MKIIDNVKLRSGTKEEILPDFMPDFPHIASYIELDKFVGKQTPWHWHKEIELFYIETGILEYHTPNETLVFPAGSGGFVNSNVLHKTIPYKNTHSTTGKVHLFDVSFICGARGSFLDHKYVLPLVNAAQVSIISLYPKEPEQEHILNMIHKTFTMKNETFTYEIDLRSFLSEIWCLLLKISEPLLSEKGDDTQNNEKIKRMLGYIQEHYMDRILVSQIADSAYISQRECFRVFQKKLHISPIEYLKSFRLQKACQMLVKGTEHMTHISQTCGLGSSSYFCKIFHESMGCTPMEYRKNWQDFTIDWH